MRIEIKNCKCGSPVSVRWMAGFSPSLQIMIAKEQGKSNIPIGSQPKWYIQCEKCGNTLIQVVSKGTYEEQQKMKKKIIREWNKAAK